MADRMTDLVNIQPVAKRPLTSGGESAPNPHLYNEAIRVRQALSNTSKADAKNIIDSHLRQFRQFYKGQFQEDPSDEDLSVFLEAVVLPRAGHFAGGAQEVADNIRTFVADRFSGRAEQISKRRLEEARPEAQRLSDVLLSEGRKQLGSIADELRDYQVRLFEKLRPQLTIMSKASGLEGGGGQLLQEQGALEDLGRGSQEFLLPRLADLASQAANIRYSGEAAPYEFERAMALGGPDTLRQLGQQAVQRAFDFSRADQNFRNQSAMLDKQLSSMPSFWESLGQNLLSSGIQGLSAGWGYRLGGPAGGLMASQATKSTGPKNPNPRDYHFDNA